MSLLSKKGKSAKISKNQSLGRDEMESVEQTTDSLDDPRMERSGTAILRDVEVQFWSFKKICTNEKYEPKFNVTVVLSKRHLESLARIKEAAIERYCSEVEPDLNKNKVEFTDSIYENEETGIVTYTFRSATDFREITDLHGEKCEPDLMIGKGSKVNIAVRAHAIKIFKSYTVTFYLNGANITDLVEYSGGRFDLRNALK